MQALGLIETRGLVAAIESADAMLKAADVALLEKTLVGGGLVSVAVTGEVAAVKAAVDAGAAAVRQLSFGLLVSEHVIPRPHGELDGLIICGTPYKDRVVTDSDVQPTMAQSSKEELADSEKPAETEEKPAEPEKEKPAEPGKEEPAEVKKNKSAKEIIMTKETIDEIITKEGVEAAIEELQRWKVIQLRTIAREYTDFGIAGRLISKADKKTLLDEFKKYYKKKK